MGQVINIGDSTDEVRLFHRRVAGPGYICFGPRNKEKAEVIAIGRGEEYTRWDGGPTPRQLQLLLEEFEAAVRDEVMRVVTEIEPEKEWEIEFPRPTGLDNVDLENCVYIIDGEGFEE